MQTDLNFSIALLMDDWSTAREVAQVLRDQGAITYLYQNLEEFWVESQQNMPDLTIIDVVKMSSGSTQFKNHPKVLNETLNFAILSKDTTKMLLNSTKGLRPVGFLHCDNTLSAQVSALARQMMMQKSLKQDKNQLLQRMQTMQDRAHRLIEEKNSSDQFRSQFEWIQETMGDLQKQCQRSNFLTAIFHYFSHWEMIDGFGIWELSTSTQKLIAPEFRHQKYNPFPSLWLGQNNPKGIERYAQEMATQVANDLFENGPIMLRIGLNNDCPQYLIYLTGKTELMDQFPWDLLESSLSDLYRRVQNTHPPIKENTNIIPMWEMLDLMDKFYQQGNNETQKVMWLSFVPLLNAIKKRPNQKFFWGSFYQDFFQQIQFRADVDTLISSMGPWGMILVVDHYKFEAEMQKISHIVSQFSYWKFFADERTVFVDDPHPTVRPLVGGAAHFLRMLEIQGDSPFSEKSAMKKENLSERYL